MDAIDGDLIYRALIEGEELSDQEMSALGFQVARLERCMEETVGRYEIKTYLVEDPDERKILKQGGIKWASSTNQPNEKGMDIVIEQGFVPDGFQNYLSSRSNFHKFMNSYRSQCQDYRDIDTDLF